MRIITLEEHITTAAIVNTSSEGQGGALPSNASSNAIARKFFDSLPVSPEDLEKIAHRHAENLLQF